ncbi:hypothetical protein [Flavobacterium rhizosphaerae]|uniref:Uncharacterized protein n=1 Tax=Flavobacterium rhizosphaerae TaxID=3163298 RepID=A0ABW8YTL5_9FLAO
MDLKSLINRIDVRAEHDDFEKKYEYKKKEIKKAEVKNIFETFKKFFKESKQFKFKENEHSITAMYRNHTIKLDMDIYKNLDNPSFELNGIIKMFDQKIYDFTAKGVYTAELPLPEQDTGEYERIVHDTTFFKDFISGSISYSFVYILAGSDIKYNDMKSLLMAL